MSTLSRILTGDLVTRDALRDGSVAKTPIPLTLLWLGAFYGACVGLFALTHATTDLPLRFLNCIIKVPLLYLTTLLATLPALYVFSALVGVKLSFRAMLTLVLAMLTTQTAVLASLGPIVALFALTSRSYAFFVLLDVAVHLLAGIIGVASFARSMRRVVAAEVESMYAEVRARHSYLHAIAAKIKIPAGDLAGPAPAAPKEEEEPAPIEDDPDLLATPTTFVFYVYLAAFLLVSTQLAWLLRPMIGDPAAPFAFFRAPSSSFGEALFRALSAALGGPPS